MTRVVVAGDLAMIYNEWTLTSSATSGESATATGRAVEVVRRQPDGHWLFVIDDPYRIAGFHVAKN